MPLVTIRTHVPTSTLPGCRGHLSDVRLLCSRPDDGAETLHQAVGRELCGSARAVVDGARRCRAAAVAGALLAPRPRRRPLATVRPADALLASVGGGRRPMTRVTAHGVPTGAVYTILLMAPRRVRRGGLRDHGRDRGPGRPGPAGTRGAGGRGGAAVLPSRRQLGGPGPVRGAGVRVLAALGQPGGLLLAATASSWWVSWCGWPPPCWPRRWCGRGSGGSRPS